MSQITEGLYRDDGEMHRWAIQRQKDGDAFELRVAIKAPYTGSARLTLFIDEAIGEEAKSVVLDAEQVDELITDLQQALSLLKGEG